MGLPCAGLRNRFVLKSISAQKLNGLSTVIITHMYVTNNAYKFLI